jgi:predicted Ser/Thr protein kinase
MVVAAMATLAIAITTLEPTAPFEQGLRLLQAEDTVVVLVEALELRLRHRGALGLIELAVLVQIELRHSLGAPIEAVAALAIAASIRECGPGNEERASDQCNLQTSEHQYLRHPVIATRVPPPTTRDAWASPLAGCRTRRRPCGILRFVAGDREDELAQTAPAPSSKPDDPLGRTATHAPTGPGDGNAKASEKPAALGKTLGKYRLERELGAGGMGVVHAAFDPDLERRVAIKVLHDQHGNDAHKQRLLREARAMARLTHPNVVTVHEVNTADGRDFVAMELVEGESLAEWLRAEKRSEEAILAAFVAAGRGLAAAHAAGMVHRDFKPHNILRSRAGRIAVTDFGLAREAHADPFATTGVVEPPIAGTPVSGSSTPSTPLAGLTMTGSVLGTPAYMAPEQWTGGAVTPATDQFAFCVALWEALSGERPFRGDTVEMLRRAVELGPEPLDDSQIPRRLRPVLRRGLDPRPAKRYPSMDALLAEMAPPKRPGIALAIGAGVVVLGAVLYVAFGRSSSAPAVEVPVVACPEPAIDPAKIALPKPERTLETVAITAELERWKAARAEACKLEPTARVPRVACLDRVLSRLDAVARAIGQLGPESDPVDTGAYTIDPAVCAINPRLEMTSPALGEAIAAAIREAATSAPVDRDAVAALLKRIGTDGCAGAWARVVAAGVQDQERNRHLADAEQDAERCSDDRIRAETAIRAAAFAAGRSIFGIPSTAKLKVAIAAVERVAQPDLIADVDKLQMEYAAKREDFGEAIQHGERAIKGYAARNRLAKQLATSLELARLREVRGTPEDLKAVRGQRLEWHATARAKLGPHHPTTRAIEISLAMTKFSDGDPLGAQAELQKLRRELPIDRKRKITVRVVDAAGKPIEGATVTAGYTVWGAGNLAAYPDAGLMDLTRSVVTPSSGEVVFDGPQDGLMIAQKGELRSRAAIIADSVTLSLEPTSRIEGKVDLRGEDSSKVMLALSDTRLPPAIRYELIAPPSADGSFVFEGVPRAKVQLFAQLLRGTTRSVTTLDLVVSQPVVRGVAIAVPNHNRAVHVIVRSTVSAPVGGAQVFVQPGSLSSTTLDKLRVVGSAAIKFAKAPDEKTAAAAKLVVRPGDVVATLSAPPTGAVSACAIGIPGEIDDPDFDRKIRDNLQKVEVRCAKIPAAAETVVIEVPPWPRLD